MKLFLPILFFITCILIIQFHFYLQDKLNPTQKGKCTFYQEKVKGICFVKINEEINIIDCREIEKKQKECK